MTILFDHQTFSIQAYGGISRYFFQLFSGINATVENRATIGVRWSDNAYLNVPPPFTSSAFRGRGRLLYTVNQWYSHQLIQRGTFDLLHTTYYDPAFLSRLGRRPFVMTIHDMIHERLHTQFEELKPDRFVEGKRQLAERASAIITVSDYTRHDVIDLLNVDPARVHVVHHASTMSVQADRGSPLPTQPPYLLFVGNRGHYKNFDGLLNALALLNSEPELLVVCAGGGGFSKQEQQLIQSMGLSKRVSQQSFHSDTALAHLYQNALAFVFPSRYEGFGIPVLEAFSCGCPCILSQSTSLPEVAADAALYVDPDSPTELAQAVRRLLSEQSTRTELVRRGYERLKQFTWAHAVEKTLSVYQSVLDNQ